MATRKGSSPPPPPLVLPPRQLLLPSSVPPAAPPAPCAIALACSARIHSLGEELRSAARSAAALASSVAQPSSTARVAPISAASSGVDAFSSSVASAARRDIRPGTKKASTPRSIPRRLHTRRTPQMHAARRAADRCIGAAASASNVDSSWPVVARMDGAQSSTAAPESPATPRPRSVSRQRSAASSVSSLVPDGPHTSSTASACATCRKMTSSCTGCSSVRAPPAASASTASASAVSATSTCTRRLLASSRALSGECSGGKALRRASTASSKRSAIRVRQIRDACESTAGGHVTGATSNAAEVWAADLSNCVPS